MFHSVENSVLISENMKDCSQNRSCHATEKSHFTFAAVILVLGLRSWGDPSASFPWEVLALLLARERVILASRKAERYREQSAALVYRPCDFHFPGIYITVVVSQGSVLFSIKLHSFRKSCLHSEAVSALAVPINSNELMRFTPGLAHNSLFHAPDALSSLLHTDKCERPPKQFWVRTLQEWGLAEGQMQPESVGNMHSLLNLAF